ncbi:uncharacterized protein C8Q71DRAFT_827037 [Rhodofomes roseus]|uniref:Uncharacterized protein n=1 Tax=Rhodofomes roseus TaxID=34475 RepID=A0ABQ8KTH0_9APHY|nr:uncharacterized protein C8Q71DRAFT_827037 [Rhodofomes roseus]KAH9842355.1 hypothetical protein C8Q71DRAFT_827037 [Rhodofomes roseus]
MRFIDDTYGDSVTGVVPTYSSDDCWDSCALNNSTACFLQPDPSKIHNGTWHDTSTDSCPGQPDNPAGHSVTFNFTGTSLQVYIVTVNQGPQAWQTNLSFNLDGEISYSEYFKSFKGDTYAFAYQVAIFTTSSPLNNTLHTFTMTALQNPTLSTVLFDFAAYTYEEEPTTSSASDSQTSTSSMQVISGSPLPGTATTSLSASASESLSTGTDTSSSSNTHVATPSISMKASSDSLSNASGTSVRDASSSTSSATANSGTTTHKGTHISAIVGGAVGGAVFIILYLCLAVYLRRRRKSHSREGIHGSSRDSSIKSAAPPFHAQHQSLPPASLVPRTNATSVMIEAAPDDVRVSLVRQFEVQTAAGSSMQPITSPHDVNPGVEAQLRTEMAALREQVARLESETERNLPPAYS